MKPAGRYPSGGRRLFDRWHWFWKVWSGELRGFGVVYVDRSLQSTIFVNHLVLVGYAADAIGSFPSGCQLGGSLGRGGEREDHAANLVRIGGGRGWGSGHLLMSKLESLLDGLDVTWGVLGGRRRAGIRDEVWGKSWFATCRDH